MASQNLPGEGAIRTDEIALLRAGSADVPVVERGVYPRPEDYGRMDETTLEMYYILGDDTSITERWSQPVPEPLTRSEGAYYALLKGLRAVEETDYQVLLVKVTSEWMCDQLRGREEPPSEVKALHERATRLLEGFDLFDVVYQSG